LLNRVAFSSENNSARDKNLPNFRYVWYVSFVDFLVFHCVHCASDAGFVKTQRILFVIAWKMPKHEIYVTGGCASCGRHESRICGTREAVYKRVLLWHLANCADPPISPITLGCLVCSTCRKASRAFFNVGTRTQHWPVSLCFFSTRFIVAAAVFHPTPLCPVHLIFHTRASLACSLADRV